MEICRLLRTESTSTRTRGVLTHNGEILCTVLELPWRDNQTDISCIPAGTYSVDVINSPAHGRCFELQGTEPRTNVQMHVANWPQELLGCIAVGTGYLANGVSNSRTALTRLLDMFPDGFNLEIKNFA